MLNYQRVSHIMSHIVPDTFTVIYPDLRGMAAMAPRLSVTQAVWAKPAATFRATGAAP